MNLIFLFRIREKYSVRVRGFSWRFNVIPTNLNCFAIDTNFDEGLNKSSVMVLKTLHYLSFKGKFSCFKSTYLLPTMAPQYSKIILHDTTSTTYPTHHIPTTPYPHPITAGALLTVTDSPDSSGQALPSNSKQDNIHHTLHCIVYYIKVITF